MSRKTVVSDYIENKLKSIKKDSFLKEVSSSNLSFYAQQNIISNEITAIEEYIKMIKENKNCYEVVNGRKVLTLKVRQYISGLKKIILKYREYYRYLKLLEKYQTRIDIIQSRIEFESNNVGLTSLQLKIMDSINKENIDSFEFKDLVDIAKFLIRNYEEPNSKLELILKDLGSRFKQYTDEEFILLSSIKSVINNKIVSLDKKDARRPKLNEFKKYVKSIIELLKNVEDQKYDYRYDVVIQLINDEYCFNRLLEEMPDIVNLKDKEGYSLSFNVINKYLDAYFLELKGKKHNNDKNNYLKIFQKIITHPYYIDSLAENNSIKDLIEAFKDTIKNGRFRREKYIEVVEALENVYVVNDTACKKYKIDENELELEKNYLLKQKNTTVRKDLTNEDTIVMCTNNEKYYNYAYSVTKNRNGNHILKVHITDMKEFVKYNSTLDLFLRDKMFKDGINWMDDELLNKFSLNINETKPAFTFQMEITPRGKINDFKCYKSNISVNDIYTYEQVNSMIKNHDLRFLTYLEINYFLSKNIDKNNYAMSMCNSFNETVFNNIGKCFDKNKWPYIFKYQKEQDNTYYMQNMIKLNPLFSKISKEHFYKFYNIICDDINYSRYSKIPERHSSLRQDYYTDLFIPLYSYIGLFLQEMLEQFYLNKTTDEVLDINRKIWNEERDNLIKMANEIKEYKRENKHMEKIKNLKGSTRWTKEI